MSAFKPTSLGTPAASKEPMAPTRLGAPARTDAPPAPTVVISPTKVASGLSVLQNFAGVPELAERLVSILPGSVQRYFDISLDVVMAALPSAPEADALAAQKVLRCADYTSWTASDWLQYGRDAQEAVSHCVTQRLSIMGRDSCRTTPRHLAKLQELLGEVLLAAKDTGLFARSPKKVWLQHEAEISHLEQLLGAGLKALTEAVNDLESLAEAEQAAALELSGHLLAVDFLANKLSPAAHQHAVTRQLALTKSQVLLTEHSAYRALDNTSLMQLIEHLNDGVLIQLPALRAQLASLSDKPSSTQRFQLIDQFDALLQSLSKR